MLKFQTGRIDFEVLNILDLDFIQSHMLHILASTMNSDLSDNGWVSSKNWSLEDFSNHFNVSTDTIKRAKSKLKTRQLLIVQGHKFKVCAEFIEAISAKDIELKRGILHHFEHAKKGQNAPLKRGKMHHKKGQNAPFEKSTPIIPIKRINKPKGNGDSKNQNSEEEKKENTKSGRMLFMVNCKKSWESHWGEKYQWDIGKSEDLRKLLEKIRKTIQEGKKRKGAANFGAPDQLVFESFKAFLEKLPEFWHDKEPSSLSRNYNSICKKIFNAKKSNKQGLNENDPNFSGFRRTKDGLIEIK